MARRAEPPLPGADEFFGFKDFDMALDVSAGRVVVGDGDFFESNVTILREGGAATSPPGAPTGLKVTAAKKTGTATVSWTKPKVGVVSTYLVKATSDLGTGASVEVAGTTTSTTFTGLRELTNHTFSVQARGPGGNGPVVTSKAVKTGGPASVGSPYEVKDRTGDQSDPAQDLVSLTGATNGDTFTLSVKAAKPVNPYTDPKFKRPGGTVMFDVELRTPRDRHGRFQHITNNDSMTIPGEDMTFRFLLPRPCPNEPPVFPARYVGGRLQASIPSRCFDRATTLRMMARTAIGASDDPYTPDSTVWSPPIRRASAKGKVTISSTKVSSATVWSASDRTVTVTVKAKHSSGIKKAVVRPFSLVSGASPVRLGKTTCKNTSKTAATCTTKFVVRPGELRDQDAGSWRVFTQVEAKNGSIAIKEKAATFSLRRGTDIVGKATVSGAKVSVSGQLTASRWNTRSYASQSNRPVRLQLKARGSSTWSTKKTLTTTASGAFSGSVSTSTKGTWRLSFATTATFAGRNLTVATTR